MLCVDTTTLQVPLAGHEWEQLRAAAEAEQRSPHDYAHDVLMNAISARAERRREAMRRVQRISERLNERLAR